MNLLLNKMVKRKFVGPLSMDHKRFKIKSKYGAPYMSSNSSWMSSGPRGRPYHSDRSARSLRSTAVARRPTIRLTDRSAMPRRNLYSTGYRVAHAAGSAAAGGAAGMWTVGPAATIASGMNPVVGSIAATGAGLAGAAYGAAASWKSTSTQKIMKGSLQNRMAGKVAIKKSGKAKVRRVKSVKVSPYLKKAIKQVNAGQTARGLYKRSFTGLIGSAVNGTAAGADKEVTSTIMNSLQTAAYFPSGAFRTVGQKSWFNALMTKATAGNDPTVLADCDLNFFTPAKIWHAASVLFNAKAESNNPYATTTGNLTTTYVPTTGVLEPEAQNVKINVVDSYAKLQFKNLSSRTIYIDIYECVTTQKFNSYNPLHDMRVLALDSQDNTASERIVSLYEINRENTATMNLSYITSQDIDAPAILKQNGWKWKYAKKSIMISGGETITHVVKGPKGMYDMSKLWDTTGADHRINNAHQNWSKHLAISVRMDPILMSSTSVNYGARLTPIILNKYELFGLVNVEVQEVMKIAVPEIAGFVSTAVVAGTGQPLNLRRRRYQITNIGPGYATLAATNLVNTSEEDPTGSTSTDILL